VFSCNLTLKSARSILPRLVQLVFNIKYWCAYSPQVTCARTILLHTHWQCIGLIAKIQYKIEFWIEPWYFELPVWRSERSDGAVEEKSKKKPNSLIYPFIYWKGSQLHNNSFIIPTSSGSITGIPVVLFWKICLARRGVWADVILGNNRKAAEEENKVKLWKGEKKYRWKENERWKDKLHADVVKSNAEFLHAELIWAYCGLGENFTFRYNFQIKIKFRGRSYK
jgi:hypothetical protein